MYKEQIAEECLKCSYLHIYSCQMDGNHVYACYKAVQNTIDKEKHTPCERFGEASPEYWRV